jgi:CheY-like chemotaxis protein/DNA-directed RNA polymerase specialized sigma24 family protein
MARSTDFFPHIPSLRRYARAMTGSQSIGDACVRAALEAMIAAPGEISETTPAKVELFRYFNAVWQPIARGLGGQPRTERAALLLVSVEAFTSADAATIMQVDEAEVNRLVQAARDSILQEIRGRVMIIEDESIIAVHLETLVDELGHTSVGVATTHAEAVALAKETRPDLILADVRLADGSSGIEAVNELMESMDVPVIFITAFPERLLSGDGGEPAYLISKPFKPEVVSATISQALFFKLESQHVAAA